MTYKIGLTGSIGMGKSTTAGLFEKHGCEIWDADAAVHRMYGVGGAAVGRISDAFPEAVVDGAVSRPALKQHLKANPDALALLNQIVHPLLVDDRAEFLSAAASDIVVFDVPLLFETGLNDTMDCTICVSVSPEIQKNRVMARGTMTLEQFDFILAQQMPNTEKTARADFVVCTETLEGAEAQVVEILAKIREGFAHA